MKQKAFVQRELQEKGREISEAFTVKLSLWKHVIVRYRCTQRHQRQEKKGCGLKKGT